MNSLLAVILVGYTMGEANAAAEWLKKRREKRAAFFGCIAKHVPGFIAGALVMCMFYLALEKFQRETVKAAIEQEGDRLTEAVTDQLDRIEARQMR